MKKILFPFLLSLFAISQTNAQFTKLHEFDGRELHNPTRPEFDGTYLYSTATSKVDYSDVIFKIKPDGTVFTKLYVNPNGQTVGHLVLSGGILYGITYEGVIYKINTDGSGYTKIASVYGVALSPLTISGNVIYGTTDQYGTYNAGFMYKINTDGTGYTKILDFEKYGNPANLNPSISSPAGDLSVSGTAIYGIAKAYRQGYGAVYKVNTDGTGCTILYSFIQKKGAYPTGELHLSGNVLYGVTSYYTDAAETDPASIFSINTDGTNYTQLHTYSSTNTTISFTVDNSVIYGTDYANNSIFSLNTDGSNYQTLFNSFNDATGAPAYKGVTKVGTILYGATDWKADGNGGSLFSFDLNNSSFTKIADMNPTPTAGIFPSGKLTASGSWLYGIAGGDLTTKYNVNFPIVPASIFKINRDGTGYTTLLDFKNTINDSTAYCNGNSLIIADQTMYGMATYGGNSMGCIFKVNTDGSGFVDLHDFNITEGGHPCGSLTLLGGNLYGMISNHIFKISTNGSNFQVLYDFPSVTLGSLIASGTALYGVIAGGGNNNSGSVFKFDTNNNSYTDMHDFDGVNDANSTCTLSLVGNTLYGTTSAYLSHTEMPDPIDIDTWYNVVTSYGCIFKINTDGSGYAHVYDFDGINGSKPYGAVTVIGSEIYGMTSAGGSKDKGVLYQYNLNTNVYTKLTDFDGNNGCVTVGAYTNQLLSYGTDLTFNNKTLYGMTRYGGSSNIGVIFSYTLPTYNVTYDANGGDNTTVVDGNSPYLEGTTAYILSQSGLARSNYDFTGWNTAPDGSGIKYDSFSPLTIPKSDITLYAQWIKSLSTGVSTTKNNQPIDVIYSNQQVFISNPESKNGEVQVFDFTGKLLIQRNTLDSFSFTALSGYYVVKVSTQDNTIVKRIIVK